MWRELAEAGIHEKELGAENDIVVERGSEEASMEVAEMGVVGGRVEKGEVVGDEVGFGFGMTHTLINFYE